MKYFIVLGLLVIFSCKSPRVGDLIEQEHVNHEYYVSNIQSIFTQYCVECHTGFDANNGLELTSYEKLMQGAIEGSGAVVVPGSADSSIIIKRLKGLGVTRMPKGRAPLADNLIDRIVKWIDDGATKD